MPNSPIHSYAFSGNKEALLKCIKDIDVNVKNPFSWTALHIASWIGNYDIVDCLINQPDIDIDIKDNKQRRPIDIARTFGNSKIVILLAKSLKNLR
jgi:ankyrin repeat protein